MTSARSTAQPTTRTDRLGVTVWIARLAGITAAMMAFVGLFNDGEHLVGLFNIDLPMDLARVLAAVALLWAGFARVGPRMPARVVSAVGVAMILVGVLGLFSPTLFGLLPSGLTAFSVVALPVFGAAGCVVALLRPLAPVPSARV